MIILKEASIDDIPLIRKLAFAIWPEAYSKILSQEQSDYMLDMMYSSESLQDQICQKLHRFIIAYEGEKAVGFASWSLLSRQNIFKLHKIYVLPNMQGKGIGRILIEQVITTVGASAPTILELNVNRFNNARDFYTRMGFSVVREEDIEIGNGFFMNDYVMQKTI